MIIIDETLASNLSIEAINTLRRRKNFNFHKKPEEFFHRFLNAIEPDSYIRPHKHLTPPKHEVFLILKGKALVVEFDENGGISCFTILDSTKGVYGAEIHPGIYHTIISLQSGTVAYECKEGPYNEVSDKIFASWAPVEQSNEAVPYIHRIIAICNAL